MQWIGITGEKGAANIVLGYTGSSPAFVMVVGGSYLHSLFPMNFVQKLVAEGTLQNMVDETKEKEGPRRPNHQGLLPLPGPPPQIRTIHMLFTTEKRGTRNQRRQQICLINQANGPDFSERPQLAPPRPSVEDPTAVWFSDSDMQKISSPNLDALVISIMVGDSLVKRKLVDNDSSTDVLLFKGFLELGFKISDLKPAMFELFAFNDTATETMGDITLPVSAGPITKMVTFAVAQFNSSYNMLLGRQWIHDMRAVPSTLHECIRYPTPLGLFEIKGNQTAFQRCMEVATKIVSQITMALGKRKLDSAKVETDMVNIRKELKKQKIMAIEEHQEFLKGCTTGQPVTLSVT